MTCNLPSGLLLSIPLSFPSQKLSFIGSRQCAQPSDKSWLMWTNHDKPVPFFPSLPCSRGWDHRTQFWQCNLRDNSLEGEEVLLGRHSFSWQMLAFHLSLFFLPYTWRYCLELRKTERPGNFQDVDQPWDYQAPAQTHSVPHLRTSDKRIKNSSF